MLSVILIKLEGGGDGREVLDGDHLLLRHGLELPDGIVHDGGELRPQRRQNLSNQSFLKINFLVKKVPVFCPLYLPGLQFSSSSVLL